MGGNMDLTRKRKLHQMGCGKLTELTCEHINLHSRIIFELFLRSRLPQICPSSHMKRVQDQLGINPPKRWCFQSWAARNPSCVLFMDFIKSMKPWTCLSLTECILHPGKPLSWYRKTQLVTSKNELSFPCDRFFSYQARLFLPIDLILCQSLSGYSCDVAERMAHCWAKVKIQTWSFWLYFFNLCPSLGGLCVSP